jgi:hypothetical protein
MSEVCGAGLLRAVVEEISKYKLDLVGVQEVRWDGVCTEPAGEYTFHVCFLLSLMQLYLCSFYDTSHI